jgi:hypothetical protein
MRHPPPKTIGVNGGMHGDVLPLPAASTHGVENAGVLCRQIYFSASVCLFSNAAMSHWQNRGSIGGTGHFWQEE